MLLALNEKLWRGDRWMNMEKRLTNDSNIRGGTECVEDDV